MIHLLLLMAAFVLELLATIGVPANRFNLMAGGLACYFLGLLIH